MSPRLSLALEGALELPGEGRIAVFGAPAGADLSALPKDRVTVVQGMYPDHAFWTRAGFDTAVRAEGDFAAAVVFVPRAKLAARALVHEASRVSGGGLVIVDGQKTDGIDSLVKALKGVVTPEAVISKAHGKIAWFTGGGFDGWQAGVTQLPGGFVTVPGVFSADGIDKGSAALVAALPDEINGHVADLGAGWGYLACDILRREGVTALDLIEADHAALECARQNIDDRRANFYWDDVTTHHPRALCDVVVSNPPFHMGRAGKPELGRAFIRTAAAMLKPNGQFWMVANRHLPYEAELEAQFRELAEVGGTPGFKVLCATKPRRQKR